MAGRAGDAGGAGGAVGALQRAASCPRHARAPESRQVLGLTGLIGQGLHSESGQREGRKGQCGNRKLCLRLTYRRSPRTDVIIVITVIIEHQGSPQR